MFGIRPEDFATKDKVVANRFGEMLEGNQLKYVVENLSGKCDYMPEARGFQRQYWKRNGYVPQFYNVIGDIIEKSSHGLFNKPIKLDITTPGGVVQDEEFNKLWVQSDAQEFFLHANKKARAFNSIVIYIQHVIGTSREITGKYQLDETLGDYLVFHYLHVGNSIVKMNPTRTKVESLAFLLSGDPKKDFRYFYIDDQVKATVRVENGKEFVESQEANTLGFCPAVMHYDTDKPQYSTWSQIPMDLLAFNDAFNANLTDMHRAMAYEKNPTLFSNLLPTKAKRQSQAVAGQTSPNNVNDIKEDELAVGIAAFVHVQSRQGETPFMQRDQVDAHLTQHMELLKNFNQLYASRYSVSLEQGEGDAQSGFQLVVRELPNLRLRERRIQTWTATLKKIHGMLKVMFPTLIDGELQVTFPDIDLPVNQTERLDNYLKLLSSGIKSKEDYYVEFEDYSEEEAQQKIATIPQQQPRVRTVSSEQIRNLANEE